MTDVQPIVQPAIENIKNAAAIAHAWASPRLQNEPEIADAFAGIARLLKDAIGQLGQPNEAAVAALRAWDQHYSQRDARDAAAVVLKAQLTGAL